MKKFIIAAILTSVSAYAMGADFVDHQGSQRGGPSIATALEGTARAYPNPVPMVHYSRTNRENAYGLRECVELAGGRSYSFSLTTSTDNGFTVKCEMKEPSTVSR